MDISIDINTDNAAFEDFDSEEVARILAEMARKMSQYNDAYGYALDHPTIRDINGNIVGHIDVTE